MGPGWISGDGTITPHRTACLERNFPGDGLSSGGSRAMDNQPEKREDAARELLLADLRHLQESFWKNEETGEKRVTFFITLVTAAITALIAIGREGTKGDLQGELLLAFGLSSLLVVGLVTLLRLIKRNEVTDGYKRDMRTIRKIFQDYYDSRGVLFGYAPFSPQNRTRPSELRKFGGLAYTVSAMNSLIISAVTALILYPGSPRPVLAVAATVTAFVAGFFIQAAYVRIRERQNQRDFFKPYFTHAGGVVTRHENGEEPLFLIVSAKKEPDHWVLPKGHIKPNEDLERTALREVWEEAGIVASVTGPLGESRFRMEAEEVITQFFLLEYIDEQESPENRAKRWCTCKEGMQLLTFQDARNLLRKAGAAAQRHSRPFSRGTR